MKKTILILLIVCVAISVPFALFAYKMSTMLDISEIKIIGEEIKLTEKFGRAATIYMENDIASYELKYEIAPSHATRKDVTFEIDGTSSVATVSNDGVVTFTGPGMVRVIVRAVHSDAYDSIHVICMPKPKT